jgi:hypothetical protein
MNEEDKEAPLTMTGALIQDNIRTGNLVAQSSLTPLQRDALIAQMRTCFFRSASARELLLQIGLSTPAHTQALYAIQDVIEASRKLALYLDAPLPSDLPSSSDLKDTI